MFAAPMSVGIPARSLAAVRCGASTRVANFLHAGFLIALLGLGSGFVSHIPIAALAGVTAWMGICLLDWSTWKRLPKMRYTPGPSDRHNHHSKRKAARPLANESVEVGDG